MGRRLRHLQNSAATLSRFATSPSRLHQGKSAAAIGAEGSRIRSRVMASRAAGSASSAGITGLSRFLDICPTMPLTMSACVSRDRSTAIRYWPTAGALGSRTCTVFTRRTTSRTCTQGRWLSPGATSACVGCASHAALNSSLKVVSPFPYMMPAATTCGRSRSFEPKDMASVSRYFQGSKAAEGMRRSRSASESSFGRFFTSRGAPSSSSAGSASSSSSSPATGTYSFFVFAHTLTEEMRMKVVSCASVATLRRLITCSTSSRSALCKSYTISEQDRTSASNRSGSPRVTTRFTPSDWISSALPSRVSSVSVPSRRFSCCRAPRRSAQSARPT
mmetsp:Transcript_102875/g.314740  ORF Transcript_102875/g.314740 Transcript_102875/m.314740 type:complete len:333 (+) Transcript_102875:1129-2127(+)